MGFINQLITGGHIHVWAIISHLSISWAPIPWKKSNDNWSQGNVFDRLNVSVFKTAFVAGIRSNQAIRTNHFLMDIGTYCMGFETGHKETLHIWSNVKITKTRRLHQLTSQHAISSARWRRKWRNMTGWWLNPPLKDMLMWDRHPISMAEQS